MEEKKYLDENQYQQKVKKLKKTGKTFLIVGICMLILGIIFLALGFTGFGKTGINMASEAGFNSMQATKEIFGNFGLFVLGDILCTFGLLAIGIGGVIAIMAHRREIMAFTVQQSMPVAKEKINEMAPTIGNAANEVAKGIKKGLNEADKEKK